MLKTIIVDDEPLAREGLASYAKELDFLQLITICENPIQLNNWLEKESIDLIFLDILMPKMNGIDFLKTLSQAPMVIITTAYPTYALEGFQLNVLDYLLKPITFDRFLKAANKAKDYFNLLQKAKELNENTLEKNKNQYFFVKSNNKIEKILLIDILFIQGMQNYIVIYTIKGKFVTLINLKTIEENLGSTSYIRVHKSYIIAIDKIEKIDNDQIFIQSQSIPISRNYREQFMKRVISDKLWNNSKTVK